MNKKIPTTIMSHHMHLKSYLSSVIKYYTKIFQQKAFNHLCLCIINKPPYITQKRKTFLSVNKTLPPTCIAGVLRVSGAISKVFRSGERLQTKKVEKNRTLWI